MQARDRLYKQRENFNTFWLSVSVCLWTLLSTLPYLNEPKGLYLATICSGEGETINVFDREGQPIKSKTWCIVCIVQGFMAEQSFSVAELILNERKEAYNAFIADLDKPQPAQHYFQTGPPEIA